MYLTNTFRSKPYHDEKSLIEHLHQIGKNNVPLDWLGDESYIPHLRLSELNNYDLEDYFGLYIESSSDFKEVGKFPNLVSLIFANERVKVIPKTLKKAVGIRYLQLTCEKMEKLPDEVSELHQLEILDLGRCENLQDITALNTSSTIVDFRITDRKNGDLILNWSPLQNLSLQKMDVKDIHLHHLTDVVPHLDKLQQLKVTIRNTQDAQILSTAQPLKSLSLQVSNQYRSEDKVNTFTTIFEQQHALEELDLHVDEYVTSIESIALLTKLKKLYLELPKYSESTPYNIYDFPSFVAALSDLEELHIVAYAGDHNHDWSLITKLEKLKRLHIGSSPIEEIPSAWSSLQNLEEISMTECRNMKRGKGLEKLPQLSTVIFQNCGCNDDWINDIAPCQLLEYIRWPYISRQEEQTLQHFFPKATIMTV